MRRITLSLLIAVCSTCFGGTSYATDDEWGKCVTNRREADRVIDVGGKAYVLSKQDRAKIEKRFTELLYVSSDDMDYVGVVPPVTTIDICPKHRVDSEGCFKIVPHKIDMQSRKAYFTDQGWRQYEKYVAILREKMRTVGSGAKPQVVVLGFVRDTDWYGYLGGNQVRFRAYANLELHAADTPAPANGLANVIIAFVPKKTGTSDEVLIDAWIVKPFFAP